MTRIVFVQHDGSTRTVDAADGESVMRAANDHGVPGIVADCGGCMSCATCHVYVPEAWVARLDPPTEDETAMLESAIDPRPNSRLSCQVIVAPGLDGLTLNLPRNQF